MHQRLNLQNFAAVTRAASKGSSRRDDAGVSDGR